MLDGTVDWSALTPYLLQTTCSLSKTVRTRARGNSISFAADLFNQDVM